jgi:hypothetical protein
MRRAAIVFAATLLAGALPASGADYFQQFVHTTIRVKLDTERKWISGTESILYVNNSPDTLREFYLHLYPNGFRDKNTAYMKSRNRPYNWTLLGVPGEHRGWLDLNDVRVDGAPAAAEIDDTIAKLTLARPLAPGDSMRVDLAFDGKVRRTLDRAGYRGDHYDFAQWYPKVVVYDEKGFHPDKFQIGEFYGEFGTFDVHIELPARFVVVATGEVKSGDPGWDYNPPKRKAGAERAADPAGTAETKTVHFHAENVHDFAWCADPTYVVQDTLIAGVEIRSAYRRRSASTWEDSTLAHAIRAVEWLNQRVGKYPYPHITVAEGLRSGGMEYPMLVMDGRASESLVFHEIGHVYFYGILANDERAEAWLDEGFTTFQTRWYQEQRYGPWGDTSRWNWYQRMTPQFRLWEDYQRQIVDLHRRGYGERVSFRAEDYDHSYRLNVYYKAALVLRALRFAAGDDAFASILQRYYEEWQFKHVNEDRFRAVCEEVAKRDLSRQFEQWLHTRKVVDYELARVRSRPAAGGVLTEVEVHRIGELYCPIEIHFTLRDGRVEKRRFDARDRTILSRVELPAAPVRTEINPDNEIMDVDPSNNVKPGKRDFQIDWPNNFYYPEDAYQIRHRPGAWYNDVDGAKLGYHLFGNLHAWKHRANLGIYYGVESDEVDFSASLEEPFRMFGSNGTARASGYKMEGRADWKLDFSFVRRPRLLDPPTQEFTVGYGYHELREARYLPSPEIYDTLQADMGPYFGYSVFPQLDVASIRFDTDLTMGREWFTGEYKYERFSTTLTMHSRPGVVKLDTRLRLFAGFAGGGTPTSRKFNLAGAGPRRAEERFWLRSPGAVPEGLHYLEPGDGNLRGYAGGTFGVNQLVAMNAELGARLALPGISKLRWLIGTPSIYGFYDVGWILDGENPIASSARVESLVSRGVLEAALQDAGVGIRSAMTWPFWNFTWRFDVPFYVTNPEVNAESKTVDWRYLFSLTATF